MTCREIEMRLGRVGIENARQETQLLVAHHTGQSEATLLARWEDDLPDREGALSRAVRLREQHYPLQYLLGAWSFWRQEYEVSPDCLIPRSDTETLVDCALRRLPKGARVLELCTGSGCIPISLLCERPDLSAVAVELYPKTLALARRNAARNGVGEDRLTFLQADVLAGDFLASLGTFDAILSNPPYIPSSDLAALQPEVGYEPSAALDGGTDGLTFYRRMLQEDYRGALKEGGVWMLEIGYDQGEALRALAKQSGCSCDIVRDLGVCDRVAIVTPTHRLE